MENKLLILFGRIFLDDVYFKQIVWDTIDERIGKIAKTTSGEKRSFIAEPDMLIFTFDTLHRPDGRFIQCKEWNPGCDFEFHEFDKTTSQKLFNRLPKEVKEWLATRNLNIPKSWEDKPWFGGYSYLDD